MSNTINYPENYTLRGFVYENKAHSDEAETLSINPDDITLGDDDDKPSRDTQWRATLCLDKKRIADITSDHLLGPVNLVFKNEDLELSFRQQVKALKVQAHDFTEQDAFINQWMLHLAEQTYHARRLELKSKHNTLFKLEGEDTDQYHMIRDTPYTPEVEGKLRLMYGKRLAFVVRT